MNVEKAKLLLAALESGEYPQVHGALEKAAGYCCLGVGCMVAEKHGVPVHRDGHYLIGSTLVIQQRAVLSWFEMDMDMHLELFYANDSDASGTFEKPKAILRKYITQQEAE